jgi:hypothetical protein
MIGHRSSSQEGRGVSQRCDRTVHTPRSMKHANYYRGSCPSGPKCGAQTYEHSTTVLELHHQRFRQSLGHLAGLVQAKGRFGCIVREGKEGENIERLKIVLCHNVSFACVIP